MLLSPCTVNAPFSGSLYNANLVEIEASFLDIGGYVISGLAISIGTGLSVNVATGTASIGGRVTAGSPFTIAGLTDGTTNHLWILNTGAGTANTSGTPPANSAKLGTCVTSGGVVTSVAMGRASGRQQFRQPQNLIPGGPAAGITSAGHPDGLNLASWGATDAEGQAFYGVLPSGAVPADTDTLAALTDVSLSGTAQGDLLYRGASAWNNLPHGTAGQVLTTNGAAANPSWTTVTLTPPTTLTLHDAQTNLETTFLSLTHSTSGTPAPGFGTGIEFGGDDSANVNRRMGRLVSDWLVATSGATISEMLLVAANGGSFVTALIADGNQLVTFPGTAYHPRAPVASANVAAVQIGDGGFAGGGTNFAGAAAGTYLAVNAASGGTAALIDLQVGGSRKVFCGAGGVMTLSNKLSTQGLQVGAATKTGNYTLTTADAVIFGDPTGGSFVVTLPTAASGGGQLYTLVKSVSSGNTLTLQGNGAELIQTAPGTSANTLVITNHATVISDGVKWYQIA